VTRVTFVGLGAMGLPMAARLARSGVAVNGRDVDASRAATWWARPEAASHEIEEADAVIVCVTDEAASETVAKEALLPRLRAGALYVDHTTTSPAFARWLAGACAARGAGFVDAPLSGGVEGAQSGALVAMAGGSGADVARAQPLLRAYAARIVALGPAGSGQLAKLANQVAIAGTLRGLAEAVGLARAGGLDCAALLEALGAGTAASAQLARTRAVLAAPDFDFRTAFAWLGKDLDLAAGEAAERGVPLPMTSLVRTALEGR
jgi:3-hydroxyisobutyrate dehydrogenase